MDNSLLAVRDINHKYIVVERRFYEKNKFLSVMAVALAAVQLISASTVTVQASTLTGAVETDDFKGSRCVNVGYVGRFGCTVLSE